MPERAMAWRQADVQACKVPLAIADGGDTGGSSKKGHDSDDEAQVEQYGFQCSPPDGDWVELSGGVQLMR